MKVSRYIYIPFIFAVLFASTFYVLFGDDFTDFLWNFVIASLTGFVVLFYNDSKIRRITPQGNKEAFNVRQSRNLFLFTNYDNAFDLCLKSIEVLSKAKIKRQDKIRGIIEAKTGMRWNVFGEKVSFRLNKVSETMIEIKLFISPIPPTALVDDGEGWKTIETISNFLNEQNDLLNKKNLRGQTEIPLKNQTIFESQTKANYT